MKRLVNGIAITAALVIAAPVWAQTQQQWNPATGQPGLGAPMPAPAPAANSATPPAHHAVRHARAMYAHHRHMAAKAALSGDTTAQLNREELARIQSGNLSNPPTPGGGAPMAGPTGGGNMGMPGEAPGGGMPPNEGAPPPAPESPGAGGPPH